MVAGAEELLKLLELWNPPCEDDVARANMRRARALTRAGNGAGLTKSSAAGTPRTALSLSRTAYSIDSDVKARPGYSALTSGWSL
jgi:hypothetical protein